MSESKTKSMLMSFETKRKKFRFYYKTEKVWMILTKREGTFSFIALRQTAQHFFKFIYSYI